MFSKFTKRVQRKTPVAADNKMFEEAVIVAGLDEIFRQAGNEYSIRYDGNVDCLTKMLDMFGEGLEDSTAKFPELVIAVLNSDADQKLTVRIGGRRVMYPKKKCMIRALGRIASMIGSVDGMARSSVAVKVEDSDDPDFEIEPDHPLVSGLRPDGSVEPVDLFNGLTEKFPCVGYGGPRVFPETHVVCVSRYCRDRGCTEFVLILNTGHCSPWYQFRGSMAEVAATHMDYKIVREFKGALNGGRAPRQPPSYKGREGGGGRDGGRDGGREGGGGRGGGAVAAAAPEI